MWSGKHLSIICGPLCRSVLLVEETGEYSNKHTSSDDRHWPNSLTMFVLQFEDSKVVIKTRNSKKGRQYDDLHKKDKYLNIHKSSENH